MKHYTVQTSRDDGHEQRFRAGARFTKTPAVITVLEKGEAPTGAAMEFTAEQFATIDADPLLKVRPHDAAADVGDKSETPKPSRK